MRDFCGNALLLAYLCRSPCQASLPATPLPMQRRYSIFNARYDDANKKTLMDYYMKVRLWAGVA